MFAIYIFYKEGVQCINEPLIPTNRVFIGLIKRVFINVYINTVLYTSHNTILYEVILMLFLCVVRSFPTPDEVI